jgi:hypothetical protein
MSITKTLPRKGSHSILFFLERFRPFLTEKIEIQNFEIFDDIPSTGSVKKL